MQSFQQSCTLMMQFVQAPAISTSRPPQRLPSSRRRCSKRVAPAMPSCRREVPTAVASLDPCVRQRHLHKEHRTRAYHSVGAAWRMPQRGRLREGWRQPDTIAGKGSPGGGIDVTIDTQGQLSNVTPQEDFMRPTVRGRSDQTQSRHCPSVA